MSKLDIQKLKQMLVEDRERLREEVTRMIDRVPETVRTPGDLSDIPTHSADRDSEGLDKEVAMITNEREMLEAIEAALERMEAGTYGRCANCHVEISPTRLKAIPYTPYCKQCAEKLQHA